MLREKYSTKDLGVSFAIVTIAVIAVQLVVAIIAQISGIDVNDATFNIVANAVNTLIIGGSAFLYAAISKTNVVKATKMNVKPSLAHIGWGCLAIVFLITFMLPLNNWIVQLIVLTGLPKPNVNLPEMSVVTMIIISAVLPAFCEEVIFRGTIANSLESNKNKLASLAIVGGLFAVFHMNPAQTIHQFVLGALLALLAYRSGSLWTAVILHLFNNGLVIALDAIWGEQIDVFFENNAIWLFFVGLICFAACVTGYLFTTKSKWQTSQTDGEQSRLTGGSIAMLSVAVGVCLLVWILNLVMPSEEADAAAIAQALGMLNG